MTARGVQRSTPRRGRLLGAPAGGLRTLRLGVAAGQFGARAAGRGQPEAGLALAAGLLEAALARRVLPGLLRLRGLPRGGAVRPALLAVRVLAVRALEVLAREVRVLEILVLEAGVLAVLVLAVRSLAVLAEQVGAAGVRTTRSVALAAGAEPGAVAEGAGEAAALTLRLRAGGVLRSGAGEPGGLEPGVLLTLLVRLALLVAGEPSREGRAARGVEPAPTWPREAPGPGARRPAGPDGAPPGREPLPGPLAPPPASRPPGAPDCCPGACLGTGCLPPCATSTGSMTSAVVPPESEGRSWIRMP